MTLLTLSAQRLKAETAKARKLRRREKAKRIAQAIVCTTSDGRPVKVRAGTRHHKLEAALQTELNRAIRLRDIGAPCITCNRPVSKANENAGHCFPVGSHPSVRFHPWNIHLQCGNPCNRFNGGEGAIYAAEIRRRYGVEAYAQMFELAQRPLRLSIPDLIHLRAVLRIEGLAGYQERYFALTGWKVGKGSSSMSEVQAVRAALEKLGQLPTPDDAVCNAVHGMMQTHMLAQAFVAEGLAACDAFEHDFSKSRGYGNVEFEAKVELIASIIKRAGLLQ